MPELKPPSETPKSEYVASWVSRELKDKAERAAAATERSVSAYLRHALRQQLRADQRALDRHEGAEA